MPQPEARGHPSGAAWRRPRRELRGVPLFTLPVTLLWSRGESPSRSPAEQQPENAAKMACGDIAPLGHGHGLQGMKVERPGTAEARQWASPAAARSAPAAAAAGGLRA